MQLDRKKIFKKIDSFGNKMGQRVSKFNCTSFLVISFFLSFKRVNWNHSYAINVFWVLYSDGSSQSPTVGPFVVKFIKGLSNYTKIHKPVNQTYPISYNELPVLFFSVSKGKSFHCLSFIFQKFLAMLILAFSSFTHFEEIQFLKLENVLMIDSDFSISFREERFCVIPSFPLKDFDPAGIFSLYLDKVLSLI